MTILIISSAFVAVAVATAVAPGFTIQKTIFCKKKKFSRQKVENYYKGKRKNKFNIKLGHTRIRQFFIPLGSRKIVGKEEEGGERCENKTREI